MAQAVRLPYKFHPRSYQKDPLRAFHEGIRRFCLVWHRRAGKDKTCINLAACASQMRVGAIYHVFPTLNQGRKIIWDGIDAQGMKVLSHFPREIIDGEPNDTEMKIQLKNGSIYQLAGTDGKNLDRLMGTNPVGVILSEFALQNPKAWQYLRPILDENGGWAAFPYTPRGANHGKKLWQAAVLDPARWFVSKLDITMTRRDAMLPKVGPDGKINWICEDGGPVIGPQAIKEALAEGVSQEVIDSEYMVDFDAPIPGALYGEALRKLETSGRSGVFPWIPDLPVYTCWDLGVDDHTAIWWFQSWYGNVRWIDYLEDNHKGMEVYMSKVLGKPYTYAKHFAPPDIAVQEWGTGKTRHQMARQLNGGNPFFTTVPKWGLNDGINALRALLGRSFFNTGDREDGRGERVEQGLNALKSYHNEFDEETGKYTDTPEHDWSEHGSSAARYGAIGFKELQPVVGGKAKVDFDPRTYDLPQRGVVVPVEVITDWDVHRS